MPRQLLGTAIASNTITTTQLQTTVVNQISAGGGPRVSSLIYPGDDTAANTVGGQTVYVTGSGFAANANVYINGNAVPSISFISASNLAITTPALSAATYPVYVINPETGATAIHIPGLRVSGDPTWVTAAGSLSASQDEASAWSYTVSANSDSAVTYALAGGSSLPTGISLAANGLISGTLSSPPGTETTYNFTVVATDAENQNASRAFSVSVSSGEGVLFANNVLLIHADGTNNKNNHTFLDSSNNNFTITRYGNPTQGSFSPFSQTGWSVYFDGSGDRFTIANSSELDQVGDYCQEGWVYPISGQSFLPFGFKDVNNYVYFGIQNNRWSVNQHYSGEIIQGSTVQYNQWTHVALTRQGSTVRLFVNGVLVGSTTNSSNISGTGTYQFGRTPDNNWNVYGYVSNWRVTKGSVPTSYQTSSTSNGTTIFTPPSSILSRTSQGASNTVLLLCQSNRFVDNSVNNFTLSREGDVSIQAFSPFAPSIAYSTANVGGSLYLDGSGDYLSFGRISGLNLGNSDWTFEFWTYATSSFGAMTMVLGSLLYDNGFGSYGFFFDTTNFRTYIRYNGGTLLEINAAISSSMQKTWSHIAVTRSGSNIRVFLNGVQQGATNTTIGSSSIDAAYAVEGYETPYAIGATQSRGSINGYYPGYIADLRLIKGNALYTSNFTPPTAPPTNIANTTLLCNFTNAGIFDQTAKNVLETVGDAKISTAQYKYGTASMYFDGTGDYLSLANNVINTIGSGDFTIETWAYPTSFANWNGIIGIGPTNASHLAMRLNSSGNIEYWLNTPSNQATSNVALSLNTWSHVALVRSGSGSNNVKLYINGSLRAQGSITYVAVSSPSRFVIGDSPAYDAPFNGYIDDFRITKGYARYTSNFTPPTAAFKDK